MLVIENRVNKPCLTQDIVQGRTMERLGKPVGDVELARYSNWLDSFVLNYFADLLKVDTDVSS